MGGAPDFGPVGGLQPLRQRVLRPTRVIISVTLPLPLELPAAPVMAGPAVRMPVVTRAARARRVNRKRTWVLDIEIEVPELEPERLLGECEEYLVDLLHGSELGVVVEVETDDAGDVSGLLVEGGWFGRRRFRVEADAIEVLLPADRRLVVRESGVRPLDGNGSA